MKSRLWFTSDTHFGHGNIIAYCGRPFVNVEAMDCALIHNWNAVVRPEDVVYHLGDISWYSDMAKLRRVRARLNGRLCLVPGNHDKVDELMDWGVVDEVLPPIYELAITDESSGRRVHLVLCHFPLEEWNRFYGGALHLHGHTHGGLPKSSGMRRLDVGVDSHGYAPVSLHTVLELQQIRVERRKN